MPDYSTVKVTNQNQGRLGQYPAETAQKIATFKKNNGGKYNGSYSIDDYLICIGKVSNPNNSRNLRKNETGLDLLGKEAAYFYKIDISNAEDNLCILDFLRGSNGKSAPYAGIDIQKVVQMLVANPLQDKHKQNEADENQTSGPPLSKGKLDDWMSGAGTNLTELEKALFSDLYSHADPARSSRWVLATLWDLQKQIEKLGDDPKPPDPEPEPDPVDEIVEPEPEKWPPSKLARPRILPRAYTLWRRENLFVQQAFGAKVDINGMMMDVNSDQNINTHMLPAEYKQIVYDEIFKDGATWDGKSDLEPRTTYMTIDGIQTVYRALKSTSHGAAKFYLIPDIQNIGYPIFEHCEKKGLVFSDVPDDSLRSLFEVSYRYHVFGVGEFRFNIDGIDKEIVYGPLPWRKGGPWKIELKTASFPGYPTFIVNYRNIGLADPPPFFEIDQIRIFEYVPIYCDTVGYVPPQADSSPTEVELLRGYKVFQQTAQIGSTISLTIRFIDEKIYQDFLRGADKVHVYYDDLGVPYRGVLELGAPKRIAESVYEISVVLKSPCKLGEGWQ